MLISRNSDKYFVNSKWEKKIQFMNLIYIMWACGQKSNYMTKWFTLTPLTIGNFNQFCAPVSENCFLVMHIVWQQPIWVRFVDGVAVVVTQYLFHFDFFALFLVCVKRIIYKQIVNIDKTDFTFAWWLRQN